jgi:GNAT superfamily N-acetyltransferase
MSADAALVRRTWKERWGDELIVSIDRTYAPQDVEGLLAADGAGEPTGLVTWARDGHQAEIVSLDALVPGEGIGRRLLAAAEEHLRASGVSRLTLVTTNDNVGAIRLYLGQGWRVVRLDLDGMDRVRELKPAVQLIGANGIPLRDMWELEKRL